MLSMMIDQVGADAYIVGPRNMKRLVAKVRELFPRRRRRMATDTGSFLNPQPAQMRIEQPADKSTAHVESDHSLRLVLQHEQLL